HDDCDAADEILLLPAEFLPHALEVMRATGRDDGLEITTESLDPAEFRWQVEKALAARVGHDADDLSGSVIPAMPVNETDGPAYPALAVLVRARMNALPVPGRPPAPHVDQTGRDAALTAMQALAEIAGRGSGGGPFDAGALVLP